MMQKCNETLAQENLHDWPLYGDWTYHKIGLVICGLFGACAILISVYLIEQHALHYTKPWEQKHIIRILFMVPVYSITSFCSYLFYHQSVYFLLLQETYEAFCLSSFFTLLCNYVAPTLHDQKGYFRSVELKNWLPPLRWYQKCTGGRWKGPFRQPRSGLTWFNVIFWGVYQYCFFQILITFVGVCFQAVDLYCATSISLKYAHIWLTLAQTITIGICMTTLIQFYWQLRKDLVQHKPTMKLVSIKLVVFFTFFQTLVVSFLCSQNGPFKPNLYIGYADLSVGVPNILLCVEMALFAILHIFAYPYKSYILGNEDFSETLAHSSSDTPTNRLDYQGGKFGWYAWFDAFNPWDIICSVCRGFKWLIFGRRFRTEDISYDPDFIAEHQKLAAVSSSESSTRPADGKEGLPSTPQSQRGGLYPRPPQGSVSEGDTMKDLPLRPPQQQSEQLSPTSMPHAQDPEAGPPSSAYSPPYGYGGPPGYSQGPPPPPGSQGPPPPPGGGYGRY